ncbi:hypothetical protein DENSPDRAFT_427500 [Dentipellis sp. KUC8613]|nr:hypothetical protein DENSPDRAFT_427500 [Dentipellis sp. KUC8613]
MDLKTQILTCVEQIHKAGVRHCDLSESNVVIRPDMHTACIIDFDNASVHKCKRRLKMGVRHYTPSKDIFGCDELFDLGEAMEIWTPCMYRTSSRVCLTHNSHMHIVVLVCATVTFFIFNRPNADRIVELVKEVLRPGEYDENEVRKEAVALLEDFYETYEHLFSTIGLADPRQIDWPTFLSVRYNGLELEDA